MRTSFPNCASRDRARAKAFSAEHGIARARTLEEALANPDADALWLCVSADAYGEVGSPSPAGDAGAAIATINPIAANT